MKIDLYTKIVLTVIAIALSVLALQPLYLPTATQAAYETMDVNIEAVGGSRIYRGSAIPVKLVEVDTFSDDVLKVECTNCP